MVPSKCRAPAQGPAQRHPEGPRAPPCPVAPAARGRVGGNAASSGAPQGAPRTSGRLLRETLLLLPASCSKDNELSSPVIAVIVTSVDAHDGPRSPAASYEPCGPRSARSLRPAYRSVCIEHLQFPAGGCASVPHLPLWGTAAPPAFAGGRGGQGRAEPGAQVRLVLRGRKNSSGRTAGDGEPPGVGVRRATGAGPGAGAAVAPAGGQVLGGAVCAVADGTVRATKPRGGPSERGAPAAQRFGDGKAPGTLGAPARDTKGIHGPHSAATT